MPELPEVERGRRIAESALCGRRITTAHVADDDIVFDGVTPREVARTLKGRTIAGVHRRGKHLWFELDRPPHPLLHFGMTGSFHVYDKLADRPTYWKLELLLEGGRRFAMRNPRRLGRIRLRDDPPNQPPISRLGFDPLLDLPRWPQLAALLARRKSPIKAALLDQSFASGVGNWIADEVLYQARIAPRRRCHELSADQVKALRAALGRVVRRAVEVDADKGRFPRTWLFHDR